MTSRHVAGKLQKPEMEKRLRFSIWYFIGAMALVLLLQMYVMPERVGEITYAQFKRLVDAGKVTDVVIGAEYVSGKLTTRDIEGILSAEQVQQLKQSGSGPYYFRAVK